MKYTIKVKSREDLIQAHKDNPLADIMHDEFELEKYADQIFTGCRATEDVNEFTLYPGGYDNGGGIIVKEEIEWVKAENEQ